MKLLLYMLFLVSTNLMAQKVFNLPRAKGDWQYIYPFADKTYVLALQYNTNSENISPIDKNTLIYFGKTGKSDKIFWKEQVFMHVVKNNVRYEDYNNDGVKDLALFINTGSRGSNEIYQLYLVNQKKHTLTKVIGFDEIANPSYHKKHQVIVGYGYSGKNNYSIYKIDNQNKIYQIGDSFEDTEALDLDGKIAEILRLNKKLILKRMNIAR